MSQPTFHDDFKVGQRVSCRLSGSLTGEIIGISSVGIIFHYIVLLDTPIQVPEFPGNSWKAVTVSGTELKVLA